jgi:predicted ATP-dependent endonuclease of OLD family
MAYIKHIEIRNFKSIKHIEFSTRRVNVFIGDINTGKSNILEVIALPVSLEEKEITDASDIGHIFHNQNYEDELKIKLENSEGKILNYRMIGNDVYISDTESDKYKLTATYNRGYDSYRDDKSKYIKPLLNDFPIKFYKASRIDYAFDYIYGYIHRILLDNKEIARFLKSILENYNLTLTVNHTDYGYKVEIYKNTGNFNIPITYNLLSTNLKKLIFYLCAIKSNSNSTVILDDINLHPVYSKLIAENIALDNSNQFFISTSDAYLLNSLVEKTNKNDISIYNVYYDKENNETKIKQISVEDVLRLDFNVFFNLD